MGNANGSAEGEKFRQGYPDDSGDDPSESQNLEFYQNSLRCQPDNMLVEEIHQAWRGSYVLLERKHGYIQWLFPIKEQGMNAESQRLMEHEKQAIRLDPKCKARFVESYSLFLDFLGIKLKDASTGEVERTANYQERFNNLLTYGHNYLRITRVFKCLGELGFEHFQAPLIKFFYHEAFETKVLEDIANSVQNWWIYTILDDALRRSLQEKMESLKPTPVQPPQPNKQKLNRLHSSRMSDDDDDDDNDDDNDDKGNDYDGERDAKVLKSFKESCD